jgi:anti-anti-sigma factor
MLADFQLSVEEGLVAVRLTGEVDMSNATDLGEGIRQATPNDAFGVVLDLSDVDYLDSSGIHLLYRLRESLRARGQALRVVVPTGSIVSDALRLAGVEGSIEVDQTLQKGLAQLRALATPQ